MVSLALCCWPVRTEELNGMAHVKACESLKKENREPSVCACMGHRMYSVMDTYIYTDMYVYNFKCALNTNKNLNIQFFKYIKIKYKCNYIKIVCV